MPRSPTLFSISSPHSQHYDVIIIGAGAAGLMCAIEAGKRGRKVAVLEKAERVGKKILISGGGRCNFTNLHVTPKNYLSRNEHFCKSALSRYPSTDFISLVRKHGITFHEKTLGQLFCDTSSKEIVNMLLKECADASVHIILDCSVKSVERGGQFSLETNQGPFMADSLVIATGGLSFPKIGATDFGYRIAEKFGLKLTECRPALVPLLFSDKDQALFSDLSGNSMDAVVSCGKAKFHEAILITHRGLSGPAILQASSYWEEGNPVTIDLFPDRDFAADLLDRKKQGDRMELKNVLAQYLPKRFAEIYCASRLPSRPLSLIADKDIRALAESLKRWIIHPAGTEGYGKAEVTLGGVDTDELSSKTMECRKVPGLYFIGEVVDVTGHLGGFNFQWAWASGFAAGQSV